MSKTVIEAVRAGDVRAAARLMRDLDDGIPAAQRTLRGLYRHAGKAFILGVTGAPGAGKSTLVDAMIGEFRKQGKSVGVVAIDPTSPYSGGAILGDRIRMQRHCLDEGVFIKSLATRGHLGGLSRSTIDVVNVMDAMGKDVVLIETVGVGQDEVEVVKVAHTNLVVVVPGLGDDIQAIKAGILEIADVFVVNKSDREGADRTCRDLETMVSLNDYEEGEWVPPVVRTEAYSGKGVPELVAVVARHAAHLFSGDRLEAFRREKASVELLEMLKTRLLEKAVADLEAEGLLGKLVSDIAARRKDPYGIVDKVVNHHFAHHLVRRGAG
jgi:LAO/AO transport system kinase